MPSGGGAFSSILWLNDLERDRQYARWPSQVRSLLQVRCLQNPFQLQHPVLSFAKSRPYQCQV